MCPARSLVGMLKRLPNDGFTTTGGRVKHPDFQVTLARIAAVAGKDTLEVYALWRDYAEKCYDQSALVWEFVQWYAMDLGGDVEALHSAEFGPEELPINILPFRAA